MEKEGKGLLLLLEKKNQSGRVSVIMLTDEETHEATLDILNHYKGIDAHVYSKTTFGDGQDFLETVEKSFRQAPRDAEKIETWQRIKRRIEARFPQYADILELPDILPVPWLDAGELNPSAFFTGREEYCREIIQKLKEHASLNIYALHGIGGIGKSEIAKQIALQLQEKRVFQDGCLWISLESSPKEGVWGVIAEKFDLFNFSKISNSEEQLEILREILKAVDPLVVLDNADDEQSLDSAYAALQGKRILITSRQRCKPGMTAEAINLDDLPSDAAVELYCTIYGKKSGSSLQTLKEQYPESLKEIAERLSGHPLSIEIIASLAAHSSQSPNDTLEQLRKQGIQALVLPDSDSRYRSERHSNIKKNFQVALEQDLSGIHESVPLLKTLFVACAALCGEYFYAEEIIKVMELYAGFYEAERQQVEKQRKEKGQRSPSPVMQLLDIAEETESEEPEEEEFIPDPDPKGIVQVILLLHHPKTIQDIVDNFVAVSLIKKTHVANDDRARYRFHPLMREFAWDILPQYLTPNIWKAVATWTAHKARTLQKDPGDQLQNFRFFLTVCKDQNLPEEFGEILFSMKEYLEKQGRWVLAIELLEMGRRWLAENLEYQRTFAFILEELGELLTRKDEDEKARTYLLQAKGIFSNIGEKEREAWADYIFYYAYPSEILQRFIHHMRNLRFTSQYQIEFVLGGELRWISSQLNSEFVPHTYWIIQRDTFQFYLNQKVVSNVDRLLSDLFTNQIKQAKFTSCERILFWVEKLQQISYSTEIQSGFWEDQFYLSLFKEEVGSASEALEKHIQTEKNLERATSDRKGIAEKQGLLYLVKQEYAEAFEHFIRDEDSRAYALLCAQLVPEVVSGEQQRKISEALATQTEKAISSSLVAFNQGVQAAYRIFQGQEQNITPQIHTFCHTLQFLEKHHRFELRWLKLLEAPVRDQVGTERYDQIQEQLTQNEVAFTPSITLFPENFPTVVRSGKDNRLMRLIPHGLCPLDAEELGGVERLWLPQYYLDVHPVTSGDYATFVAEKQYTPPTHWEGQEPDEAEKDLPVTGITYEDAEAYCEWAGKVLPHAYELKRAALLQRGLDLDSEWSKEITTEELDRWLEDFCNSLSERSAEDLDWGNLREENSPEQTSYLRHLSWKEGLPDEMTASAFLGVESASETDLENFLDLLSASLSLQLADKTSLLNNYANYESEQIENITHFLLEERTLLPLLDVDKTPNIRQLVDFRWNEWRTLAQTRCGLIPEQKGNDIDTIRFGSQNPFDYAPSFDRFFPEGFDLTHYFNDSLSPEQQEAALHFLKNLSETPIIDFSAKQRVMFEITNSGSDVEPLIQLSRRMSQLRSTPAEDVHHFTQQLVELQRAWAAWEPLTDELVRLCQEGKKFFEGKEKLLGTPELSESVWGTNPFQKLPLWNAFSEDSVDIRKIMPEHPGTTFDEEQYLSLLAGSISLTKEQKFAVLQTIPKLSQGQIDELIRILTEERKTFGELDRKHWPQLNSLYQQHYSQWKELVTELVEGTRSLHDTPIDADGFAQASNAAPKALQNERNVFTGEKSEYSQQADAPQPYQQTTPWNACLQGTVDIRKILLEHPKANFDETGFLDLVAGSIAMTKDEKYQVLKAVPTLSQAQVDELIRLLLEERKKFSELEPKHWEQFQFLYRQHQLEWDALVTEIFEGQRKIEKTPEEQAKNQKATTTKHIQKVRSNDANIAAIDFSIIDNPPEELKENAFAFPPECDATLPDDVDIRWIIPEHPDIFFAEKRFLQLLFGSISLTKEEKGKVLEAMPKLNQDQINELTRILLEEKRKFMELDPKHWPQLNRLSQQHWHEWAELVFELLSELGYEYTKALVDTESLEFSYLDGQLWHWTSSKHYQTGKSHALAGGPAYPPDDDSQKELFFPVRREGFSDTDNTELWGFRCCIPVFSQNDIEGLIPIEEAAK